MGRKRRIVGELHQRVHYETQLREREINTDQASGINVIEMPIRDTLGIMSTGHNISVATY